MIPASLLPPPPVRTSTHAAGAARRAFLLVVLGPWCLGGEKAPPVSPAQSRSAQQKLDRIADGKLRPGAVVVLTEGEINSYLRYDYAEEIPPGLSDPHLRLESDRVIGDVMVDFVEWQAARGESPGMLLGFLLRGKRRVEVTARFTSARGRGQADIESVRIAGVAVSPAVVRFLIENVVQPRYPEAVVGRPVELGYGLEQVRVERGRAVVVGGKQPG